MKTKTTTKSKSYWDQLLAKQRKAGPKHKAARKPQPKAKTMTTQAEAEPVEETAAPEQHEEFLPPPDPPFEESLPMPPPAPDAVSHEEKGAQPENPTALRELQIAPESTPGAEGPKPEEA